MAAPHVAGVAALVKAEGITEPDEVFSVLMKSARFSKMILNHFGAGHLDAAGGEACGAGDKSVSKISSGGERTAISISASGLMEVRSRCCPRLQWYLVPILACFLRVYFRSAGLGL